MPATAPPSPNRPRRIPSDPGALTFLALFLLFFAAVVLSHWTLLRLPYFWDEGGYYVPAALDFFHTGTLIPVFTNAHPPLPSVILGSLWHLFGVHILVTRLAACAFAAAALTAVWALGDSLLGRRGAVALCFLTAIYPIWFAQSSLAHADIFAAAFSLAALACYLTAPDLLGSGVNEASSLTRLCWCSALFCLSVLAKETAIVQPLALLAAESVTPLRDQANPARRRSAMRWIAALLPPFPVLACWFAYHYWQTGHIFGNPEFLRYNATANFTLAHVFYAIRIRFVHLVWQRNMWVPLALAVASLLVQSRVSGRALGLSAAVLQAIGVLLAANWLAFSVLGGALLTRYLLPVYPLLLLVCVATWQEHLRSWVWFATLTAGAFLTGIWLNPFTFFAPEDNLTYRDMVVVQQQAIEFLNRQDPQATVLTVWPVSAELTRPELGYTSHPFHVIQINDFLPGTLMGARQHEGDYDTALVFTTHYVSPAFRAYLHNHPASWRARRYAANLDLLPQQVALMLGGKVVWAADHNGEWAAVIRFPRSYDARLPNTPKASSGSRIESSILHTQRSALVHSTPSRPGP